MKQKICSLALAGLLAFGAVPAKTDSLAGSYLSASHANLQNDYRAAAQFYQRALNRDPSNVFLMQNALLALVAKGDVSRAVEIAERLVKEEATTQLADLVLLSYAIKSDDFDGAARVLARGENSFTPLLHGLMSGWVELGRGKMASASLQFEKMKEPDALRLFGQYHKALALAVVGDLETADKILQGDERGSLRLNRGSLLAHAQILSQLERKDDALELLDSALSGTQDLQIRALRDEIEANGAVPFEFISNATEGASEVFFTLASALNSEENDYSSLLYARLSHYLRPDNTPAILLAAEILRGQEQFDLATEIYTEVPPDHPMFLNAELGRSDTLLDAEQPEAAVEVLRGLSRSHPDIPRIKMSLGDVLRSEERYAEARDAYEEALAQIAEPQPNHWFLLYAMAICSERLGDWDRAEKDFRRALELNPGQPLVLNYLGYSLVENGMKLEEAQDMIQRAVDARPDSGFITDSLGWVFYKLGKFDQAVAPMERAVELIPDDPIINDHLGDVYWKVDRKREAEFQWKRALSFDPEEKDAERIRRKLDIGLDRVLENEKTLEAASGDAN